MLPSHPLPRPASAPRSRRDGKRRAVASALALVALAAIVAVGLVAAPTEASTGDGPIDELTADLPIIPLDTPEATQPESGPHLTRAVWDQAIGRAVTIVGATKLGAPYVYSAGGPYAFDCSGFVRWVWLQFGVTLPHNSVAQWNVIDPIPVSELRAGDLVFDSMGGPPDHVAIYVGDGMMIHAPNGGGVVRYDPVGWWTGATVTAGRVPLPA